MLKESHTTLWTFLAGLVMFFFVGIPLAATGIAVLVGLGSMFVIVGLITIFAAFKMNGDNERRKKQAQTMARQMAKLYPRGFYPAPQQIVIQAPPTSTHTEVTREIVKVRCKHCNALNFETANYCTNCRASL
jgi:hypothetical protein